MSRQETTEKIQSKRELDERILADLKEKIGKHGSATYIKNRMAHRIAERLGYRIEAGRGPMFIRVFPPDKT